MTFMPKYIVSPTRIGLGLVAVLACATAASAQDGAPKHLTLLGIPSATVAPNGLAFASLSGTTRRAGSTDGELDGSLALGFGLGSAEDGIGLQFTVQTTSLTNSFGDSGYLSFKASRRIAGVTMPTYLGLSVDQIGNWGDASDVDIRGSLMVTSFTKLQFGATGDSFPVIMTLGVGSDLRDNASKTAVFGGVGIGLTESIGASLAWNGENVDFGTSFRVKGLSNFGVTAVVNDAFDQDDSRRVTFTVNWFLRDAFGG